MTNHHDPNQIKLFGPIFQLVINLYSYNFYTNWSVVWSIKCQEMLIKVQDDVLKCLVLSTTQKYLVSCQRGVKKNLKIPWFQLLKCEYSVVSLLLSDSKLNILGCGQNKTFEDVILDFDQHFSTNNWSINRENMPQLNQWWK